MRENRRVAPYGKPLLERHKWKNPPFMVVVSVGMGAWSSAKRRQQFQTDILPLVLPDCDSPEKYQWPVSGCMVYVERLPGPADSHILELVKELLRAGAESVYVWDKDSKPKILPFWVEES